MKKIFVLFLSCLLLVGCSFMEGSGATKAKPNKEYKTDSLSFKVIGMDVYSSTTAPIFSSSYYIDNNNYSTDFLVEVKNTSKKKLKIKDVLEATILTGSGDTEKETSASMSIESKDRTELLDAYTLKADETVRVHLYSLFSTVHEKANITIKVEEEEYDFTLKQSDFTAEKAYKSMGENITTSDGMSIDILEPVATKQINPSKMEGLYQYYKVQDNSTSLVGVKVKVKNTGTTEKDLKKFIGTRLIIDGDHFYKDTGMIVRESTDKKNIVDNDPILPGEETIVYCVVILNDTELNKSMEIRLDTIDGTTHIKK